LHDASPTFSISDLLGHEVVVHVAHSQKVKDTVWIARLEGGGVISYARSDGSWLNTLNTEQGFERKMRQLEISFQKNTT